MIRWKKNIQNIKICLKYIKLNRNVVLKNYLQIKNEVREIIHIEIDRMMNTPELFGLLIKK
jgi:hypothetical protein